MINFKHLKEMEQNWWEHALVAWKNLPKAVSATVLSFIMIFIIIIHGLFPFIFYNTIGRWLKYLNRL